MRSIPLSALGSAALLVPSMWLGIGCAAGDTVGSTSSSSSTSSGTGGGANTTSSSSGGGGKGGTGGTGGMGGTGGAGATGGAGGTGGTGGAGGSMCVPAPELCDGIDNDCNGTVDDGCLCKSGDTQPCFTGDPATLGVGVCAGGTQTCDIQGAWGACAGEVTATPEVCDGLDNDCNGSVDEGLGQTTCGLGICTVTVTNCLNGAPKACIPGDAKTETCNGADDDCDGVVDEGCNCVDGAVQPCYSGSPGTLNVGECKAGSQTCTNGNWGPCMGDVLPKVEACNAKDDDCNGAIDDGLGQTTCGLGACKATVQNCIGGLVQTCVAGSPTPELCNGVDDDCNGSVDDGLGTIQCGLGECLNVVPFCNNGQLNSCVPKPPSAEVCDGKDNNCDGVADEGDPGGGAACTTGNLGVCAAGVAHCQSGSLTCVQTAQPGAEVCDGKDNDCDGQVDEGNPGGNMPCTTGLLGVCAAGMTACSGGALACVQSAQPSAETCDGLDNNCNGQADEGNPGGGLACDTGKLGVCQAGTTVCGNGVITCNQVAQPSPELCDGKDNNCNGQVDEGNPEAGGPCSTAKPGVCAAGTFQCQGGQLACVQNTAPSAETCDGKDNDCNGQVDEGNPGGGQLCGTGLPGVCGAGTTACTNGSIVCTQTVSPSPEVCDGQDNDCNGFADDGNPGANQPCTTGKPGVCAAGTTACISGALQCNQTTPASSEVCDGFDNDCDGLTDEDFDFQTDPNNCGGCGIVCGSATGGLCCAGVCQASSATNCGACGKPCSVGMLVINEIHIDPAIVADDQGEWFELYNPNAWSIDLRGFVIKDLGGETHTITSTLPVVIPGNAYALLARNANTGTNGGLPSVDYQYSSFQLGNSGDEVLIVAHGTTLDQVVWSSSFVTSGKSKELSRNHRTSTLNDNASNWCTATTSYSAGEMGTPKQQNTCAL